MELWLILAILSNLFGAITSSLDKHFLNQRQNPFMANTAKMFFDGLFLLIFGLIFF